MCVFFSFEGKERRCAKRRKKERKVWNDSLDSCWIILEWMEEEDGKSFLSILKIERVGWIVSYCYL